MGFYEQLGGGGNAPPSPSVRQYIKQFVDVVSDELQMSRDKWEPKALTPHDLSGSGERIITEGIIGDIIEGQDYWRCIYVLSLQDGRRLNVPAKVTKHEVKDVPQGSLQFAGVWYKPGIHSGAKDIIEDIKGSLQQMVLDL